ncbi:MAG TPA: hypothetical protein VJ952_03885 [Opitutales bacterium]|nr:hypothetical protein [Opitutales bacterium]
MPPKLPTPKKNKNEDTVLVWLVYSYIVLLVFEGALRKWILPGLSDLLLLVRDPIVLISYAWAIIHGRPLLNNYILSAALLITVCTGTALLFGHGNLVVTAFGIRTNFLHFPFAFIIGRVLTRDLVIDVGRWWLWCSVGMTILVVSQYLMPQSAWVNRSVGGGEGAGFSGALGRYRPPATFSFIIGTVQFYTLSMAFLIAGLIQHKRYTKKLLLLSAAAILVAIPVSISRSLILSCAIVVAAGLFTGGMQKGSMIRFLRLGLIGMIALFIATKIPVFDDALEAFSARWERSTGADQGGFKEAIVGRFFEMFTGPFKDIEDLPIFGYGLGAGTQIGTKLLSGERGFSLGESEWNRVFGEYGFILGLLFIIWRVSLCAKLLQLSIKTLAKGNGIPLILLSTTAINLVTGQLGQTTVNGFTVVGVGLVIASMRPRNPETVEENSANGT